MIFPVLFTSCGGKDMSNEKVQNPTSQEEDWRADMKRGISVYKQASTLTGRWSPVAYASKTYGVSVIQLVDCKTPEDIEKAGDAIFFLPFSCGSVADLSVSESSPEGIFVPIYWEIDKSDNSNNGWILSVNVIGFGDSGEITPRNPVVITGEKEEIDRIISLLEREDFTLYVGEGHPGVG